MKVGEEGEKVKKLGFFNIRGFFNTNLGELTEGMGRFEVKQ